MMIKERETNMMHDSTRKRKEWKATGNEDNTEDGQKKPGHKGKGNFSFFSSPERNLTWGYHSFQLPLGASSY